MAKVMASLWYYQVIMACNFQLILIVRGIGSLNRENIRMAST